MGIEQEMRDSVNRCRELHNQFLEQDPVTKEWKTTVRYEPGDRGYLPPADDFVTIHFRHGVIVIPAEEFKKLSKAKQRKLMRW